LSELNLINFSLAIDQSPESGSDEIFTSSSGVFIAKIENLMHHFAQGMRRFVQTDSNETPTLNEIRTELGDIKTQAVTFVQFRKGGILQNAAELGLDQVFYRIRSVQDDTHTLVQPSRGMSV
jgi:hypothetical protein